MNVSVSAIFFFLNSFVFSNFRLSCQLTTIGTARPATKTLLHMGNLESRFFVEFAFSFVLALDVWMRYTERHPRTRYAKCESSFKRVLQVELLIPAHTHV